MDKCLLQKAYIIYQLYFQQADIQGSCYLTTGAWFPCQTMSVDPHTEIELD